MAKPPPGTLLNVDDPITDGLVGAYLFNEGTGGVGDPIYDHSGLGHHAIIGSGAGTPASYWDLTPHPFGPAFIVDNSPVEMWARIPHHTDFNFAASGFSVVLGYAANPSKLTQFDSAISKLSTDAWNTGFNIYQVRTGPMDWGVMFSIFADGLEDMGAGPSPYDDTNYHQIVATFNADPAIEQANLYMTCEIRETKPPLPGALGSVHTNNSSDIYIGRSSVAAPTRAWSGKIYYLYIYNRPLSFDEVNGICGTPFEVFQSTVTTVYLNPQALVHPVVELTLGGDMYRFAEYSVTSENKGLYLPYVESFGEMSRRANVTDYSLEVPEFDVTIFDQDRVLQKLLGGPLRGSIRESLAETWWRSPDVPVEDHYRDFTGVINSYSGAGDRRYRFRLRPDMRALESPPKIPYFSLAHFPTAPERSHGQPLWSVYGRHLSAGIADSAGMINCLPAEELPNGDCNLWLANYGLMAFVYPIRVDGIDRTIEFEVFALSRDTAMYYMLRFIGPGTPPTIESTVTIDGEGLRLTSPTVGAVIANPATQIRHFLKTFCYGNGDMRPAAAWPSESNTPIASEVFNLCEAFFNVHSAEGAFVVYSDDICLDVFNTWCQTHKAAPFFTDQFQIAALPRDLGDVNIVRDDWHVAQKLQHALDDLTFDTRRNVPVSDLVMNYLYDEARGMFVKSGLVAYRRPEMLIIEETYDQPYSRRRAL